MNNKYKHITGFILAGGESKRMGVNKALLKIGELTIIQKSVNLMKSVFENVCVNTNDFESYKFLGLPMVADIQNSFGPLSGIYAALSSSKTEKNFILSGDLPLMSEDMIRYIIEYKTISPITISSSAGRNQYLCGVYAKSLVPVIEKLFSQPDYFEKKNGKISVSVRSLIVNCMAEIVEPDILPFYSEELYFNLNTWDDFELLKKKITG